MRLWGCTRADLRVVLADAPEEGALLTFDGLERHGSLDVQETTEVAVAFDVRPCLDLETVLGEALGPHAALAGAPARTPSDVTTLAGVGRLTGAIGLCTAGLAVAALVHALLVVVRLRRRELAILRALGCADGRARQPSCSPL